MSLSLVCLSRKNREAAIKSINHLAKKMETFGRSVRFMSLYPFPHSSSLPVYLSFWLYVIIKSFRSEEKERRRKLKLFLNHLFLGIGCDFSRGHTFQYWKAGALQEGWFPSRHIFWYSSDVTSRPKY